MGNNANENHLVSDAEYEFEVIEEYKKSRKSKKLSTDRIVIISLVGTTLIGLGLFLNYLDSEEEYIEVISHFVRDAGIAFLSAGLIAGIIEIPNLVDFLKELIIAALKDNNYLKELSSPELEAVKERCNKLLFLNHGKRDDAYLNESLIEFENEVFRLLMNPYYEYFSNTIDCCDYSENAGVDFPGTICLKKVVQTNFKIVNPLLGQQTEKILNPVNFYCPDHFKDYNKLFRVTRFRIKIDKEAEFRDLTKEISVHFEDFNSTKHPNYNKRLIYKHNNQELKFPFQHEIIVDMEEERLISIDDKIYTKRVDKPTKNLTVNYVYYNENYKIKADCFCTLPILINDNIISTEHSQSVFIETKSWLLPGNGILVAIVPKETSKDTQIPKATDGVKADGVKDDEEGTLTAAKP